MISNNRAPDRVLLATIHPLSRQRRRFVRPGTARDVGRDARSRSSYFADPEYARRATAMTAWRSASYYCKSLNDRTQRDYTVDCRENLRMVQSMSITEARYRTRGLQTCAVTVRAVRIDLWCLFVLRCRIMPVQSLLGLRVF